MQWKQSWQSPMPGEHPCGEDISFDPEFETLRDEVEKSLSLHGGAATDWELVLRTASAVLEHKSKDLWAFCYGTRAAYACDGLAGCTNALGVLNDFLAGFWDTLHPAPSRPARRAAPFLWLNARLEPLLCADGFPFETAEVTEAFHKELSRLQAVLDDKFGDAAPSFAKVLNAVPKPPKDPPSPAPSGTDNTDANRPSPRPSTMPSDLLKELDGDGRVPDSILPQLLRATQEQCRQLAVHYLAQDATDWRAYFLHRTALWSTVTQLPQVDAKGMTQLRPVVPGDQAAAYAAAVESEQYAAVLPRLERSAGNAPFWLDGHRLVARCLEKLGALPAHSALTTPLKLLLERFPELSGYRFYDSTPFASPDTRLWLEELLEKNSARQAPEAVWTDDEDRPGPEGISSGEALLRRAVALSKTDGFEAGLALLGNIPAGRSRAAIIHGMQVARYCLETGRRGNAALLLQSLCDRLEEWNLLDWEPGLSAKIISLLLTAEKGRKSEKHAPLLRKLHWLHPEAAFFTFADINS